MSDYSKTTNFTAKDSLSTGDPNKLIKGSLFDTEFDAISTAVATKSNKVSGGTTNNLIKQTATGDLADSTSITDDGSEVTIVTGRTFNVFDDGGLKINGTAVTATAAELNRLDGSTAGTAITTGDAATESVQGIIELATAAEVAALTDPARAVTPNTLGSTTASETQQGIIELATSAETIALTDTARAVTPATLADVVGMVFISNNSFTSQTTLDLDTIFEDNTGYDFFRVFCKLTTSTQCAYELRFTEDSGSTYDSGSHYMYAGEGRNASTGASQTVSSGGTTTEGLLTHTSFSTTTEPAILDILFWVDRSSSFAHCISGSSVVAASGANMLYFHVSSFWTSTNPADGFQILASTGTTNVSGNVIVFGIKQ